jgi:hypothetical protein
MAGIHPGKTNPSPLNQFFVPKKPSILPLKGSTNKQAIKPHAFVFSNSQD